ncbi:hypothetical protein HA402_010972 [Bradysia odoriphaga]|nr:hypothetical protein HA402_010972 [Bradysia odoriphaga]
MKDSDDIFSKSYIPGTLTKHKFETLGTRDAVKDSRQNYLSNQKKEQALAADHANKMYSEAICKWPKPRVIAVQNDPDKLYTPHCTILHRCGDDAGCCLTDSRTCAVKFYEHVDLYFYVKSLHQRTGTIEKRTFVNHTECFCDSKANAKSPRPEPMRLATVISCTCTKAFEQVLEEDGTCRCDCSSSNYACDWKKKGREHFSMEDRKCILEGRCNPPTCEFGRYDKRHGRCPRKEDKLATGFSYHS